MLGLVSIGPTRVPVRSASTVLSAYERYLIRLIHLERWNQRDAAVLLGVSQATLCRHVGDAIRKLAEAWERDGGLVLDPENF